MPCGDSSHACQECLLILGIGVNAYVRSCLIGIVKVLRVHVYQVLCTFILQIMSCLDLFIKRFCTVYLIEVVLLE